MLNFDEVRELKKFLAKNDAANIHLHDTCGGQYFSLDTADEKTENLINEYFTQRKIKIIFADDKLGFTVL